MVMKKMPQILQQEVWFAEFPFADDKQQFKERPVIVLDVDDETCSVFSMKITSRKPYDEFEIELFDWANIPLDHISTAIASQVIEIHKTNFRRKIGRLSNDDWENINDLHNRYLKSIGLNF